MDIPLFKVYMPKGVEVGLSEVLHSGYVAEGESVRAFERHLKEFIGNENIVTTNACTNAIYLALQMCRADEPYSYVLTSPMTCVATNTPIQNIGARVIWVDSDPKNGMMSPEALHRALEDFRMNKPVAVIYACWGGDLGFLPEVDAICKEFGVKLIVDAAQAFGCKYDGEHRLGDGKYGDYVCLSFQAIKHITTGDGGAMTITNPDEHKRAFILKWFGIDREGFRTSCGEIDWKADIPEIGFKFHMNNIAGCIGCAQMEDKTFESRLQKYQANDLALREGLRGIMERSWDGPTASWVATFLYDRPTELLNFLSERGIHISQMHVNNDVYSGFRKATSASGRLPGVESFMRRHICLPCGWWLDDNDIEYIVKSVREFEKR